MFQFAGDGVRLPAAPSVTDSKSKVSVSFSVASSSSMTSRIERGRSAGRFDNMRITRPRNCAGMSCAGLISGTGSSSTRLTSKRG